MLNRRAAQRGFNIVELLITVLILGVVIGIGGPSFFEWMQNQQVRTAADSIQNGLQVARGAAIQRNLAVQIVIGPGTGWNVRESVSGTLIESRSHEEGTTSAVVTPTPAGATTVTFSPLGGRQANIDGSPVLSQVELNNTGNSARKLRVVVSGGGSIRMCDPTPGIVPPDPRAC